MCTTVEYVEAGVWMETSTELVIIRNIIISLNLNLILYNNQNLYLKNCVYAVWIGVWSGSPLLAKIANTVFFLDVKFKFKNHSDHHCLTNYDDHHLSLVISNGPSSMDNPLMGTIVIANIIYWIFGGYHNDDHYR